MLKLRNVAWFGRKLKKRKSSSTFSDQLLFCFKLASLVDFQIYRWWRSQGLGYVIAFWAMEYCMKHGW